MNRDYLREEFGMQMTPQLADVQGRVLPAPVLDVGGKDNRLTPHDGSWDMRSREFYRGAVIDCWAIVLFMNEKNCRADAVRSFAGTFRTVASREGIRVSSDPVAVKYERQHRVGVSNSASDWAAVFSLCIGLGRVMEWL